MKKFDTYKECVIITPDSDYTQIFTNDWTFRDIQTWMLDTYCIDKDNILSMRISSVTIYKLKNHGND